MLTPTQYEAVGRLTIGFNDIELVIRVYTGFFLAPDETALRETISLQEKSFHQEQDLFAKILLALGSEYPSLHPEVAAVSSLVNQASLFSKQRNCVVHGILAPDDGPGGWGLRHKRREVGCDEQVLNALAGQASDVAENLVKKCGELMTALSEMRAIRSKKRNAIQG